MPSLHDTYIDDEGMRNVVPNRLSDERLLMRSLAILHRFATERTGWQRFFSRWYYSDEPLRNDAANLVREAGFDMPRPIGTRMLGDET